jgi:hypothetical protein
MLAKNGEWEEAVKIYQLARLADNYNKWIYKNSLENRIKNVKENMVLFNKPLDEINLHAQTVMMVNSGFSCTGCHGMSKEELNSFGDHQPPSSYYFKDKLN